jgi:hypothetical protein
VFLFFLKRYLAFRQSGKLTGLKSLLLGIKGDCICNTQKTNGLGRIRTGDLRHVKTEDLGLSEAFAVGEITTRNAKAPS